MQPPANIPIADLDAKVAEVNEGLKDQGISLNQIDMDDPGSVTRFVENAVPLRTKDLQYMRAVHEGLENAAVAARPPHGETVAVLGAVVAVVVATPVVAVVRMQTLEDIAQSEIGVTGVTRTPGGFVLYGPGGVRVEGLGVNDVANIITRLRSQTGAGGAGE